MEQHDFDVDAGAQPASLNKKSTRAREQNQLDFEIEFYAGILDRFPDYVDVLRIQGNNLTLKGRYAEGLKIDKKLIQLRPDDPLVYYNLACSYALLDRKDKAIHALQRSIELGYRDFRYLEEDRDLDTIRQDPRFRQLMTDLEDC